MFRSLVLALTAAIALGANPVRAETDDARRTIQLLDYLVVDYAGAVQDGEVVDAGEYAEMQEFSKVVWQQIGALPARPSREPLLAQAQHLQELVAAHADPARLRETATAMRQALVHDYGIRVAPDRAPDLGQGAQIYEAQCSGCHGLAGAGDGPLAAGLEPRPVAFTDPERYSQRSVYGLYSTITMGVEGTSMPAYAALSEQERWSLAFHVGGMAAPAPTAAAAVDPSLDLDTLSGSTPAQLVAAHGPQAAAWMAAFRHDPAPWFDGGAAGMAPLANARARLAQVQASYAKGETEQAYAEALAAYLEGFELAENALDAIDHPLRLQIEKDMMALRSAVKAGEPAAQVGQQVEELQGLLSTAEERLGARRLDGMGALISALLILLREGLEAILVVAALAAFLVKTGQREGLRYLHAGWAGALLLGGLTWWISEHLFSIGGAQRELTEGIGALVAAAVMFFVGFWMHDRSQAAQWQRYVQGSVRKVLTTGRLWGLAGLSFIAVYRECFETVLFYQALWTQVDEGGRSFALAGIGIAAASLAVLAWLITRYSVRLPLRQFFAATGVFLFVLAIIFAGKGVVALQEAGLLPPLAISGPRIELLGIYPNLLSLGLQTILIVLAILTTRRAARTVETE